MDKLTMDNLRAAMPALEAAWDRLMTTPDEPGLVGQALMDKWNSRIGEYNEVAKQAALALWEDTKDRNSRATILQVYGTPRPDGIAAPPCSFRDFIRPEAR